MSEARASATLSTGLAMALLEPCLLCGDAEIVGAGSFEPDDAQEFGAPIGKRRLLFFSLCADCVADGYPAEAIEDTLAGRAEAAMSS